MTVEPVNEHYAGQREKLFGGTPRCSRTTYSTRGSGTEKTSVRPYWTTVLAGGSPSMLCSGTGAFQRAKLLLVSIPQFTFLLSSSVQDGNMYPWDAHGYLLHPRSNDKRRMLLESLARTFWCTVQPAHLCPVQMRDGICLLRSPHSRGFGRPSAAETCRGAKLKYIIGSALTLLGHFWASGVPRQLPLAPNNLGFQLPWPYFAPANDLLRTLR